MNNRNLNEVLQKLNNEYYSVLKNNAKVRTGALKSSIESKLKTGDDGILTEMLEYGNKSHVWKDNTSPTTRLIDIVTEKYTTDLAKAFAEDLKLQVVKNK